MNTLSFNDLALSEALNKALSSMGYEAPTPIQAQCIPHIMEGRDLAGQAQTGTGKTAAFGIPMLEKVDTRLNAVQMIVQCPTRELAIQVTGELMKMGRYIDGLRVVPVYGGQPIHRQITALQRGAQILVGTPGRTLDHLQRGTLKLDDLKMLVFDEADEMLNMGFREDMEALLSHVGHRVQTVMFSATFPPFIRQVMKEFMDNPVSIIAESKAISAPDIRQFVVQVRDSMRTEAISRIMDVQNFKLGIIFCNTKRATEFLVQELLSRGYSCDVLNGDLSQPQRDKVMNSFRTGRLDLLVATDVAARGIDVDDVDVVFNFELPTDPEYYVHRIGRTGRAGKAGTSITFCPPNRSRQLRSIERQISQSLEIMPMPSSDDVQRSRMELQLVGLRTELEKGGLREWIDQIEAFAEELGTYSPVEIAAAMLRQRTGAMQPGEVDSVAASLGDDRGGSRPHNDQNKVTLKFSIGRNDNVRPGDLVGAIAGEAGVSSDVIGHINILKFESFVDVESSDVNRIMTAIRRSGIKGKPVDIVIAPPSGHKESRPGKSARKGPEKSSRSFSGKKGFAKKGYGKSGYKN
jgi:ATP-dependent RNA helicase DeaD